MGGPRDGLKALDVIPAASAAFLAAGERLESPKPGTHVPPPGYYVGY